MQHGRDRGDARSDEAGLGGRTRNIGSGEPPHARLGAAFVGGTARLRRRAPNPAVSAWTRSMTAWALAALAGSVILGWLGDAAAIEVFHANRRDGVLRWLASITDLGQSHWYLVPAALAAISIGLADWSRRDSRGRARLSFLFGQAGFVFAAVALSGILVNVAKFLVGRARPRLRDEVGTFGFDPFGFDYLYHSYPSGHSTTVGAVALVLMLWFPRRWAVILVLTGLLAFSRVAALAHYPSDVVAGYAFGFLSSLFLARWLARRGVVFRVVEGSLLPVLRHARAWRAVLPRH